MMLVTVLTLPLRAGEGNQAVCGRLRQFRAVDAKAAVEAGCNSDAATRGMLMMKKRWRTGCLPSCRARKVAGMVPKNVLSLPMITGLNVSDEGEMVPFQAPSQVGVLSLKERGILRRQRLGPHDRRL